MAVDTNAARRKDQELLAKVMAPFLSGEQDSAKIPGFAEEKKLASRQHSAKVAGLLYEVAQAFDEVLPSDDPARGDALVWAKRAFVLLPADSTRRLINNLSRN